MCFSGGARRGKKGLNSGVWIEFLPRVVKSCCGENIKLEHCIFLCGDSFERSSLQAVFEDGTELCMRLFTIAFVCLLFSSCMTTSSRSSSTDAKAEKDRLLNSYAMKIAEIFGSKLNDPKARNAYFNSQNDFEVSQWIDKYLSKEMYYYERRIKDDWRGYLRKNAPGSIARDSNRLEKLVQVIGKDFRLYVEVFLINWKRDNE